MAAREEIRIVRAYRDAWGQMREVPDDTVRQLEVALRTQGDGAAEPQSAGREIRRCFEPEWIGRNQRRWGIAAQLYGIRSGRNWGIGDFTDLKTLTRLAAQQGADFVGINPLHALYAAEPRRYSPYSPSSREFLNVLYLDPEAMLGIAVSRAARDCIAEHGFQKRLAALRDTSLVEYEEVARIKDEVFRLIFTDFAALCAREPHHPLAARFAQFIKEGGEALRHFAVYQALSCRPGFGDNWKAWPEAFRDPVGAAVQEFAADDPLAIAYHEFLQWEADVQLGACAVTARDVGMEIGLYLDLAVGAAPESIEGWSEQASVLPGFHIGAPPDQLNEAGQDWGLAVFDPYAADGSDYRVHRRILRAAMRYAAALRIDHVLGLSRLFLVPAGSRPTDGAYLRLPASRLCDMVAEESSRERCIVIGEDLGTVPEGFPALLAEHNILSCRLLIFTRDGDRFLAPEEYPRNALVSIGTHDVPPLLGFIEGTDIEARQRLGTYADEAHYRQAIEERAHERRRLREAVTAAGFSAGEDVAGISAACHGFLARTPCALFLVQLEDLAVEREQRNLPGSDARYPNWRYKLSHDLEAVFAAPSTEAILGAVRRERPRCGPP